jgi:hypothetical protein
VGGYGHLDHHHDYPYECAGDRAEAPAGVETGQDRTPEPALDRRSLNVQSHVPRANVEAEHEQAGDHKRQADQMADRRRCQPDREQHGERRYRAAGAEVSDDLARQR